MLSRISSAVRSAIICLLILTLSAVCAESQTSDREPPESSVVFIQSGFRDDNNTFVTVEEGSGFIVEASGWVVTASHVLNATVPANKAHAYFGSVRSRYGDKYEMFAVPGPVVSSDFGLLRFSPALGRSWATLKVLSNHQTSASDSITAIGFPIGLEITVRRGNVTNTFGPNGAIGTSAGLAPGMSGGPVLLGNSRCVVGMVTAGANFAGYDWFTPTSLAKPLLDVPPAQFVLDNQGLCDTSQAQQNGSVVTDKACDGMPGETAWIYVGQYNGFTGNFVHGPFLKAEAGNVPVQNIPEGSWIVLSESRKTMILDYATKGIDRAMDSPFRLDGHVSYTCKVFPAGQRLYVAGKEINGPSSEIQHVWFRVRLEPPGG